MQYLTDHVVRVERRVLVSDGTTEAGEKLATATKILQTPLLCQLGIFCLCRAPAGIVLEADVVPLAEQLQEP